MFTSANAEVKAKLKGTQLSNETDAFSSGSQRKFVKDKDGTMHHVYSSMGSVWYETRTDNGATWVLVNGTPVASGKNPSISVNDNGSELLTIISYQHGSTIKYKLFVDGTVEDSNTFQASAADPVVTWFNNHWVAVVYEVFDQGMTPGLYIQVGEYQPTNNSILWKEYVQQYNGQKISYTDDNSINPTITAVKSANMIYLAYQNGTSSINYQQLYWNFKREEVTCSTVETPSVGATGFSNFQPSISLYGEYPVVVWIRQNIHTYIKECALRIRFSPTSWSQFYSYGYGGGDDVDIANINEGGNYDFILAWGGYGNNDKYLKSNSTTNIYSLTTSGDVQVSNGNGFSGMRIQSFDKYNSPHNFTLAGTDGMLKSNSSNFVSVGREFNLLNEGLTVRSGISDIRVDGGRVAFAGEGSFLETEVQNFDSKLETESFTLTNNSEFSFSTYFDASLLSPSALSSSNDVKIKIKLIDAQTDETIGVLQERILDGSTQLQSSINNLLVNTSGIGEREVKLVIKVKDRLKKKTNYTVTTRVISEGRELQKDNFEEITYKGEAPVTSYDLAQNYPNPFNPTTTIKYQIPNAGNVSLKIYDVLGAELMTLVNTTQSEGRYEVKFDASQLSSGVYIYRIQANDYAASKKMILLK
ncbi:MAG: T9SS C-terminal target domain-containing protein [Ignavibacteriae bacterium]|nr:T9SS C-terminal target domain-containing protein [Ignavibacteriota bacterium]